MTGTKAPRARYCISVASNISFSRYRLQCGYQLSLSPKNTFGKPPEANFKEGNMGGGEDC